MCSVIATNFEPESTIAILNRDILGYIFNLTYPMGCARNIFRVVSKEWKFFVDIAPAPKICIRANTLAEFEASHTPGVCPKHKELMRIVEPNPASHKTMTRLAEEAFQITQLALITESPYPSLIQELRTYLPEQFPVVIFFDRDLPGDETIINTNKKKYNIRLIFHSNPREYMSRHWIHFHIPYGRYPIVLECYFKQVMPLDTFICCINGTCEFAGETLYDQLHVVDPDTAKYLLEHDCLDEQLLNDLRARRGIPDPIDSCN